MSSTDQFAPRLQYPQFWDDRWDSEAYKQPSPICNTDDNYFWYTWSADVLADSSLFNTSAATTPAVVANDDDQISSFGGDEDYDSMDQPFDNNPDYYFAIKGNLIPPASPEPESLGLDHVPYDSDLEEDEVSEDEESDDFSDSDFESSDDESSSVLRPAQVAQKRLPGAGGKGKGQWPHSAGIASVDTAEGREVVVLDDEDEDEDEDEEEATKEDDQQEANDASSEGEAEADDSSDDDYQASSRRPRRTTATTTTTTTNTARKQPVTTAAPVASSSALSGRRASSWSAAEDQACINAMMDVCTNTQTAAIASTEKRFEEVARRMVAGGFQRSASGVKLQWNRRLRALSGFEDRGDKKHSGSGLTTSSLVKTSRRHNPSATASSSTTVGTTAAHSTTSSQTLAPSSRDKGKGRAIEVSSDEDDEDTDDDDDVDYDAPVAPRRPAKRRRNDDDEPAPSISQKQPRISRVPTLPSTQDHAYYSVSNANIINVPRTRPSLYARRPEPIPEENAADDEDDIPQPSQTRAAQPSRPRPAKRLRPDHPQAVAQKKRKNVDLDEDEDDEPIISNANRVKRSRTLRQRSRLQEQYQEPQHTEQIQDNDDDVGYLGQRELQEDVAVAEDDEDEDDEAAEQLRRDEEMARKLQAQLNGGNARSRRGRGFN